MTRFQYVKRFAYPGPPTYPDDTIYLYFGKSSSFFLPIVCWGEEGWEWGDVCGPWQESKGPLGHQNPTALAGAQILADYVKDKRGFRVTI